MLIALFSAAGILNLNTGPGKMRSLILILLYVTFPLSGQELSERVILFSDRNMYITGEPVQFSALITSVNTKTKPLSRILYCEIITPDGKQIASGKFAAYNFKITGRIVIPQDLLTGNYYMRVYTKLMRNEGPSVYSYTFLKIVNPFRDEIRTTKNGYAETRLIRNDIEESDDLVISSPEKVNPDEDIIIKVSPDSVCRELRNLTVSIIPGNTFQDKSAGISSDYNGIIGNRYAPETEGVTITGLVRNRTTRDGIPGIRINLSIIGEGNDFMSTKTGPSGRFNFTVHDYYGNRDIFLSSERSDSLDAEILVDNDFCAIPVQLPDETFELSGVEREIALTMARNLQVGSWFYADTADSGYEVNVDTALFYGEPDDVLIMDNYVQLSTLEDYFNELPTFVRVRKQSGRKYFRVSGPQAALTEIEPLVMIDLVAIDDPDKILALDPREINRIDIVNNVYIKGDQLYGGIINIISENGDFAGISLPASGIFVNYDFLDNKGAETRYPNNDVNQFGPDARNTVLWQEAGSDNFCSEIKLHAPAAPGLYMIVIRGVNENGKKIIRTSSFKVIRE